LAMTETAPLAMSAHVTDWQVGELGIPLPGMEVKLAPVAGKLEVRYRGPNVTPGYWRDPEQTRQAFDDEGFFCGGDAARFIDPAHPECGLKFDGRLAEDFKLATGTFVSVGELRARLQAVGAPLIQDAVIAGQDRDEVTALIFLNLPSCTGFAPQLPNPVTLADAARSPEIRRYIQEALDALATRSTGSSTRIARAVLVEDAPSFDLGEATDKGTLNQRAVLKVRAQLVDQLYTAPFPRHILVAAS
jgi:feruloyl-CoA synthase